MKFDTYNYCLGSHFISAIEYGDESGLTDEESGQLAEFLETLPRGAGHWSYGEHEEFARCDVSGMHGDCTRADYLVPYSLELSNGS